MDTENSARAEVVPLHRPRRSGRPKPIEVEAHAGAVTASFQIRYVGGPEAERIAAQQARAVVALLRWLNSRDSNRTSHLAQTVGLDAWGRDGKQEEAA